MNCERAFMKVYKELKRRDNGYSEKLISLIDSSKKDIKNHLEQINLSMPNYDLHNAKHSAKVLSNIEKLLGSRVKLLSECELFMIYMAAYLHDSGMGLPVYELELLKRTEGNAKYQLHPELDARILNDGCPEYKRTEAQTFIEKNKKCIYEDFKKIESFIFMDDTEEHFIRHLGESLIDYQKFRNGFTGKLNQAKDQIMYQEISDSIREQYIRITHGERSKNYIINWGLKNSNDPTRYWLKKMSIDLAQICLAHTGDNKSTKVLTNNYIYTDGLTANSQFIAVLLRLGDALHFSIDRASKSLQSQKNIRNAVSIGHWEVKQEAVSYQISSDKKKERQISFTAFCSEPQNYYFLHGYLDSVDVELERYQHFLKSSRYGIETDENEIKYAKEKYQLNLPLKVDRTHITYDENKFHPELGLKLKIEQQNVMKLLMGVGLYKNKYLALRELYQNSLDACRVAIASIENFTQARIEFGLGYSSDKKKYIYCLDNGCGMDKEILRNYFTNAGRSYYQSEEFYQHLANWDTKFQPVSCFGIGALSYFMLGDRVEVITKNTHQEHAVNLVIERVGEILYYQAAEAEDIEKIKDHGTLVKIFLNNNDDILDYDIEEIDKFMLKSAPIGDINFSYYNERFSEKLFKEQGNHIILHLAMLLKSINENIDVHVKYGYDKNFKLKNSWIPHKLKDDFSDYLNLMFTNQLNSESNYYSYGGSEWFLNTYFEIENSFTKDVINVKGENIEIIKYPMFPKVNNSLEFDCYRRKNQIYIDTFDYKPFQFSDRSENLMDGIIINNHYFFDSIECLEWRYEVNNYSNRILETTANDRIINFHGRIKPTLSIDRKDIVSIPKELFLELVRLSEIYNKKLINRINDYLENYSMNKNDCSWLHSVIEKYGDSYVAWQESKISESKLPVLPFIEDVSVNSLTFDELRTISTFKLKVSGSILCTSALSYFALVEKFASADNIQFSNDLIICKSKNEMDITIFENAFKDDLICLIIQADDWVGRYHEYDQVTGVSPLVPERVFNKFVNRETEKYSVKNINERTKLIQLKKGDYGDLISYSGASLLGKLAEIAPAFIHPYPNNLICDYSSYDQDSYINPYHHHEILDSRYFEQKVFVNSVDDKIEFFFYAYVSPIKLTNESKLKLEQFKNSHSDYYQGVKEGWSVLFLGNTGKYVVRPGVNKREDMVELVDELFWENNQDKKFYFLDDTPVKINKCQ